MYYIIMCYAVQMSSNRMDCRFRIALKILCTCTKVELVDHMKHMEQLETISHTLDNLNHVLDNIHHLLDNPGQVVDRLCTPNRLHHLGDL